MNAPGFWDDPQGAGEVSQRRARLQAPLETLAELVELNEEVEVLIELAEEEDDAEAAGRRESGFYNWRGSWPRSR